MKKKRGIFAGRQQTPPAIPPTQISDAKLLADLDVEIAAAERAANPPEGSTAVINALSPGLAAMMPTPGRARHQVRRPVDPRPAPRPLRRLHTPGGSHPAAGRGQARDPADRPALLLRRPEGGAEVDRQHRHRAQGRQGPEDRQRHPQHPGLPKPDPGGPDRHPVPLCLHLHRLENVGVPVRPRRGRRLRRQVGARVGQGHAGHGRRLALTA